MNFKYLYQRYLPTSWLIKKADYQYKRKFNNLYRTILGFFEKKAQSEGLNADEKEIYSYLKANFLTVFPYSFSSKYNLLDVHVEYDQSTGFPFVMWNSKKLYFKKNMTSFEIQRAVCALQQEQDPLSPHRYLTPDFKAPDNVVIVDAGAAEGNFSLDLIETAKKIYLIEADPQWIEPLQLTFAPWRNKVEIINKYASDTSDSNSIKLDDLFTKEDKPDFIKIDVEGHEEKVINGSSAIISAQHQLKMVVCTYHRQNDAEVLQNMVSGLGFKTDFSDRYMFFIYDNNQKPPYLRKGLLRAFKGRE